MIFSRCFLTTLFSASAFLSLTTSAQQTGAQTRSLGIDVSAWQGTIQQSTWNNLYNVENREFVFIRSSRGGTTGFYNQSDPSNNQQNNTLSQRYDDHFFVQNITRATNAGLMAGPYHFARPDIVSSTFQSGGIANTGADEADHFMQMSGAWMRPGYLLPVFDLEAGQAERTNNELAQFSIDFSDRIYEVMGIRPAMYNNGNYANDLEGASSSLEDEIVEKYPVLWSARPIDFNSVDIQTANPKDSFTPIYGPWDDGANPTHPWSFWQYSFTGRLNSYNNGNSDLDFNVAQGGTEFLKDNLVPAIWMDDADGEWTTLANWNSGQTPIAPVQGSGQNNRVGALFLPTERLPTSDDTVILDRDNAAVTVTLSSGFHNIRKLYVREALDITGGSLSVGYVPSADSTPLSAQFSSPVSVSGGSFSAHTLQVDAGQTFSLGSNLIFDTVNLIPSNSSPASIEIIDDISFTSINGETAIIQRGAGSGLTGDFDLMGEDRAMFVINGAAATDVVIDVPIVNGALTKQGSGTLAIQSISSYEGDTTVEGGTLSIDNAFLSNLADVYLSDGATLDLDFLDTDVIDSLFFGEDAQATGTWGAIGSGAQHTSSMISGTGFLRVSTSDIALPGDYNDDGFVDAADYTTWRDNQGAAEGTLANDVDGGVIGAAQYATWVANYGSQLASSSSTTSVPEPTSCMLIGLATCFLAAKRRN